MPVRPMPGSTNDDFWRLAEAPAATCGQRAPPARCSAASASSTRAAAAARSVLCASARATSSAVAASPKLSHQGEIDGPPGSVPAAPA